ncbi:hypothetical protein ACD591_05290 [Rufibacter glacialis]|uniref:Uncharacterized protein n=1 Tax=Rufibacter glacialis TaxID=1259555 RepID=A0A5M8QIH7_9BACT|nr:hypothetical protein [Rufibacter glacialis]KAA6434760.1 hypothetical protein FOE74_11345 [Rufibacter glacialis]GGK72186.1 hypothetical protein GCM10011405_20550 [Rufibacter glacialis]
MRKQEIIESTGARASLFLGLPLGISAMVLFAMVSVLITGESLFLFGWFFTNGIPTLGLLVAFTLILWFAGKMLAGDIYANKGRFWSIMKYPTLVNLVIWSVFLLVYLVANKGLDTYFGLEVPLTLAVISVLFTPFTVGLWIYNAVDKRIKMPSPNKVHSLGSAMPPRILHEQLALS